MTNHWDEFSKSLVEKSVPRRQTLRLLGAALAGAFLAPLGLRTAEAAGDSCKSFCNRYSKSRRSACLAACRACSGDTSRVCSSGSSFTCCSGGTTCCSGICTSLADDFDNCGACGLLCADPGPYENGACVDGQCFYSCVDGATDCGGTCTDLGTDPDNCGACSNACPEWAPYCDLGACSPCAPGLVLCGDSCIDLASDPNNCGACGNVCPESAPNCYQGACVGGCQGSCPEGWCGGDGCGGECACPAGWECGETGWCINPCVFPFIPCNGVCVDPTSNHNNCGGCGVQCAPDEACISGSCLSG